MGNTDSQLNPDEEVRVISVDFALRLVNYEDKGSYDAKQVVSDAATIEAFISKGATASGGDATDG